MIIRVVIADDQPAVRDALRVTLDGESDIEVVSEAADGAEAVHQALWRRPDVVVMDLRMPYVDGISAIRQLADVEAPPRVLALTTFDTDEYLFGALQSGVCQARNSGSKRRRVTAAATRPLPVRSPRSEGRTAEPLLEAEAHLG
ncbi:response regulator [Nonomuraea mesophila]|uniref:response regulator n=1 Tax=Nonomuraea mesophila TaxID=2530382 RepID=UPI001C6FE7A9|nr:response regulator transcription factor [Nonomuraea mesophila]